MQIKSKKIIRNIVLIIIMMVSAILFSTNIAQAATWNGTATGGMPTFGAMNAKTGLFPQVLNPGKTITTDAARLDPTATTWKSYYSQGMVYCANMGKILRNGKFDEEPYFITGVSNGNKEEVTYTNVINGLIDDWEGQIKVAYKEYNDNNAPEEYDIKNVKIQFNVDDKTSDGFNKDAYVGVPNGTATSDMLNVLPVIENNHLYLRMMDINDTLVGKKPTPYSADIDSVNTYGEYAGGINLGPLVCVMETKEGEGDGYKASGTTQTYSNTAEAYVLTALEDVYGNSKYTEEDIQGAYWLLVDNDYKNMDKINKTKGSTLVAQAQKYVDFYNNVQKNGYQASIDKSNAQVIVNRNTQEYIVGPFKLNYPDYTDMSYVKSMSIIAETETGTKKTLTIDQNNQGFELIMEAEAPKSNGLTKQFPQSGKGFYIKFKAANANYPTKIGLEASFEYIKDVRINYNTLTSDANIYQYIGHTDTNPASKYAMKQAQFIISATISYEEYQKVEKEVEVATGNKVHIQEKHNNVPEQNDFSCCDGGIRIGHKGNVNHYGDYSQTYDCSICGGAQTVHKSPHNKAEKSDFSCCGGKDETKIEKQTSYEWVEVTEDTMYWKNKDYYTTIYQPYVQMDEEPLPIDEEAQPLIATLDGSREYNIVKASTGIQPDIDLTIELGGKVWEDTIGGKESIANSIYEKDQDNVMPGVLVTLYRIDGTNKTFVKNTKTDKNGEYRFEDLNAMYKYSITFTYNGQYYQPTKYISGNDKDNGWGKGNWKINSNAKDDKSERENFNLKFASIGSSPANYSVSSNINKTYTKQELLDAKIIDEFGNLILESSTNLEEKQMIQFVKDCMMNAYTIEEYPIPSKFLIGAEYKYRNTPSILLGNGISGISMLYDSAYYINLGLERRQEADLAVKKDVDHVTLEINGQTHTYTYDTLENNDNAEAEWDIKVRISDAYYDTKYSRELYKSDYLYKVTDYGENFALYGKSEQDELEVYITYKIMIRNQSTTIEAKIDELVDYYDEDLEYVDERSYIKIGQNTYATKSTTTSRYEKNSAATKTTLDKYNNVYIQGLDDKYLGANQTAYVYLTFKVEKDPENGNRIKLDENVQSGATIGVGKENIVEINGYSTRYASGTEVPNVGNVGGQAAGLIDKDSNPGNLNPADVPKDGTIKYENFEDDTDKAPNIRLRLYRDDDEANRVISGVVWEDERTETIEATTTGDGIRKDNEKLINGVTVQLVELMENGTEFVWRTFENGSGTADKTSPIINAYNLVQDYKFDKNHDGAYAFKSFVPGKYVVRFIYGDTEKTVLTKDVNTTVNKTLGKTGLNDKSYNGQDFKSTTYQEGIAQNKTYAWREESTWKNGQETLGKVLTQISTFKSDASNNETANAKLNELKAYLYDIAASDKVNNVSDAKDIESRRNEVIDYSDETINHIAEVLASYEELPEYLGTNYNKTQLQSLIDELMAQTQMRAETGVIVVEFEYDKTASGNQVVNNKASYAISNVDLGLEERPKAQLAIDKEVTNVKLTLADGSILFDAKGTASNVLWKDHKAYNVGYKGNFMDSAKFGDMTNIRNKNANKFGLIQLSMDEELMHGATMEITYQVTVSNVGEVDYKDNSFYYTGNVSDKSKVVTTKASQVMDYVANNLQFNVNNNSYWKVISKDDITSQGLVNTALNSQLEKYNTIIVTENLGANLVPSLYKDKVNKNAIDSTSVPLVLTQLITLENDTDDLTYRNIVEIVKVGNTVGRKMEYSIVGNQNPEEEPQELDSDRAEVVKILPPFGNSGIYYIIAIITIVATGIIIGGVIFIKKKILTK